MKKFYLIAVMAIMALTASAQQRLYLSTYAGTSLEKFDGKECNVNVSRQLFHGWNTLTLPFALDEKEVNETFGSDCRLERLVGIESSDNAVTLIFQDCKAQGIQSNVPYILYYNGENGACRIAKTAVLENKAASLTFSDGHETVTMVGAQKQTEAKGLYGILVRDNSEALFSAVGDISNGGFYATRCFVKLSSGTNKNTQTIHLAAGETTGIAALGTIGRAVDVYSVSGQKVASKANAAQMRQLQPGVYVVDGQKVLVK